MAGVFGEPIIKQRGPGEVHLLIFRDLVHGLTGPGFGGKIDNGLMSRKYGGPNARVTYIAADKTNRRSEISWELGVAAVDLWAKVVEESDGVASHEESPRQTGSDETSTAGDEYVQEADSLWLKTRMRRHPV
jgi:hypothetical protein